MLKAAVQTRTAAFHLERDVIVIRTEPLKNGRFVQVDDTCTFGIDAVLLSEFAKTRPSDRACDLGTGCGIIPLLWHTAEQGPLVDAVDCSNRAVTLCRDSVEKNGLSHRINVWKQDWCALSLPAGAYDVVTCNPPYFSRGSGKVSEQADRRLARHETATTLTDVVAAAHRLLKNGGHFYLCHRPERLADVFQTLRGQGLEPKRLQFVHARPDTPPFLFLCDAAKGGGTQLTVLPPHFLER